MSDDDKGGLPAVAVNLAALRKKANQALDDCEFYSGGTGQKLEVLAMHGEIALSMIPTILAEFRSAIARAEKAEAERDAAEKEALRADDAGRAATGALMDQIARAEAAEAQVERLREAAGPFAAHYEPWMDEYPNDTKSITFPRHTFGQIRKLRAALEPSDG